MVTAPEGTFKVKGQELYTRSWLPDGPPRAKLFFVHGFSDHINRYYGLFPALAAAGVAVYGFDQRGWGRSVHRPSDKGRTGPTTTVLSDIVAFITAHLPSAEPVFVMGHSMGGGEVATLMADPHYRDSLVRHVRGWLLESPFIDFPKGEEPSGLTIFFGRLAGHLLPHMQMRHVIPPEKLSRDPAVVASIRDDALCHNTGTLEGLAGMLDRTEALAAGKTVVGPAVRSLWVGHGTVDYGTSYPASRKWTEEQLAVADKTFKTYEGWYHQLHAEPGKEEFYKDVVDWVVARCGKEGEEEVVASEARQADASGTVEAVGGDGKAAEPKL